MRQRSELRQPHMERKVNQHLSVLPLNDFAVVSSRPFSFWDGSPRVKLGPLGAEAALSNSRESLQATLHAFAEKVMRPIGGRSTAGPRKRSSIKARSSGCFAGLTLNAEFQCKRARAPLPKHAGATASIATFMIAAQAQTGLPAEPEPANVDAPQEKFLIDRARQLGLSRLC